MVGWTVFDESLQSIDGFCRLREIRSRSISAFLGAWEGSYDGCGLDVSGGGWTHIPNLRHHCDRRFLRLWKWAGLLTIMSGMNEWHVFIGNTISHLFQEVDAIYDYPGIELAADSFLGYVD
jgi:hypothetical protein